VGQQRYALRYTRRMMCQHSRSDKCNREMMKVQLWADEDCEAGDKTQIVTTNTQPRTRNLFKHPRTMLQRTAPSRILLHLPCGPRSIQASAGGKRRRLLSHN